MGQKLEEIIATRIKDLGITQRKMCNDLGISCANTCSFLKGNRGVKYNTLIEIIKYLGLTFGVEGEETSSVKIEDAPSFFKQRIKNTGKHINEMDLPIHYCTLVSFITGDRMVTSSIIAKLMPMFGITLLPYKEKEV